MIENVFEPDGNRTVIMPQAKLKELAKGAGISGDSTAEIIKDPKAADLVVKELTATGKEGKLKVGLDFAFASHSCRTLQ